MVCRSVWIIARSRALEIADVSPPVAPVPSTNFDALSTFMASRRPILSGPSSNAESWPGRSDPARQRMASVPYWASSAVGVVTLPLDFDIFFRSGSSTKPEIMAFAHGV